MTKKEILLQYDYPEKWKFFQRKKKLNKLRLKINDK